MGFAEGPADGALSAGWLGLMFDEVDHGMVLRDGKVEVLYANHAARAECDATHPLQLLGRRLQARQPEHELTPVETRVLAGLCDGLHPREWAQRHGVSLATVRSQIGGLRAKTGAGSMRDLVRQVSLLPPMRSSLRTPA
jgi:DNA-binding CsgD family transcriptional regulator